MAELQRRLQLEEAQKARRLLVLAGKMSHLEAFNTVKNQIEIQLGIKNGTRNTI